MVWGELFDSQFTSASADGARLDPRTRTWRPIPTAPVPARGFAGAAWSGREVLIWGGQPALTTQARAFTSVGRGAAYDPATNRWRALPLSPRGPSRPRRRSGPDPLRRHRGIRRRRPARARSRGCRLRPGDRQVDGPAGRAVLPAAGSQRTDRTRRPTRGGFATWTGSAVLSWAGATMSSRAHGRTGSSGRPPPEVATGVGGARRGSWRPGGARRPGCWRSRHRGDDSVETKLRTNVETKLRTNVETKLRTNVETKLRTNVETKLRTNVETKVGTNVETKVGTNVGTNVGTEVDGRGDGGGDGGVLVQHIGNGCLAT